jgi:hypothetical protein
VLLRRRGGIVTKISGFFLMAIVTIIVFLIVKTIAGTFIGIVVALAIFVIWSRYNRRESTTGLYKANLFAYFTARKQGCSHEEALIHVVRTRYPFSTDKQQEILYKFKSTVDAFKHGLMTMSPEEEVQMLVYTIFCESNGIPPEDVGGKIIEQIAITYNEYKPK